MPEQQFDLETLHHIFEQLSKDTGTDCSKLIHDVTESLCESVLNTPLQFQKKKTFASLKVLLNLYENLLTNSREVKTNIPIDIIIQTVKYMLVCGDGNCSSPNSDNQCNVISIVLLLFKTILLKNSQENLVKLAELYHYILRCLNPNSGKCNPQCLIFKLKILRSIYYVLTCTRSHEFFEILKLKNDLDECKLYADLVLHHNDNLVVQILMYLIPEYINCFKTDKILEVTWKQLSICITHCSDEYFKALVVLCIFFDIYFEKSKLSNKLDLSVLFLEDVNYWKLLQFALVEKDHIKRKQGMYLLRKTHELLCKTNRNFVCSEENIIFSWDLNRKDELVNIYKEIIISLEFLEEQQVHIVKPIFQVILTLGEKIIKCKKVNYSWILLLYKKALMHESTQISLWGLQNFLKLPELFFSNEYMVNKIVCLLVDTLNNMSLYYNGGLAINEELRNFFIWIANLNTSKEFFKLLIKHICSQVWSPEALFFVIHSLSGLHKYLSSKEPRRFSFWGKEEISIIRVFVSKALRTQSKIIRTGIQYELLNAISILTDDREVKLEEVIHLISGLFTREPLERGSNTWGRFIDWLSSAYTKQEAEDALNKFMKPERESEVNAKFLSWLIIVLHDCFYADQQKLGSCEKIENPLVNYLFEMCLLFREIDKRPYCNKLLYDQHLFVICSVFEKNLIHPIGTLMNISLPFSKDFVLYIQIQLKQMSNLEDFNSCQLYLNCFQIIMKTLLKFTPELVNDAYVEILKEIETCLNSNTSPIGNYWRIKVFSLLLELNSFEVKHGLWESYLLKGVNEPLEKNEDDSKKTRDLQTLWGKMNSEFLEGKWKALDFLIKNKQIIYGKSAVEEAFSTEIDFFVRLCIEALDSAGYGVLCPVMSVFKVLLPVLEDSVELRRVVDLVWKLVMEKRKTEEFKFFIEHFIQMLYQEGFIAKGKFALNILHEYSNFIFSDSSLAVVNILMKHIEHINLLDYSVPLFCHIIGKGLIFGHVQKKDERLTNQVCRHIEDLEICEVKKIGEFNTSKEIRARAVKMLLTLKKVNSSHRNAAKTLMRTLLEMEMDTNKNRTRYFGNSHVHRVKHRLMQALLLLEPFLTPNEDEVKELSIWLYRCLLSENSQPSVRYQQEWLLVRMLLRHTSLQSQHYVRNYIEGSTESNKRGLCSIIAVSFHLCKLVSHELLEERIRSEIDGIFSLCFHQHFEVRLYAQVIVVELYSLAESRKLTEKITAFEHVIANLKDFLKKNLKGNHGKNFQKLSRSFYFTEFNPLEHYSLQTIYDNLPRLSNVDYDEWISPEVFERCGVDGESSSIPLKCRQPFRGSLFMEIFSMQENSSLAEITEKNSKDILGNYQKKIIPNKTLIPEWDESGADECNNLKQEGLIVVASLVDRIPNLGGLARTCEIFGVPELVVNSLKHTEDKQFLSLSVTAEKWITLREVKIHHLLDYLSEMKADGYTVIGAEQTLHSIPLSSAKFPKKSLLLLGNEKEGIPPNLLPLLDLCVEIPQLGIIRSLNVHVTGALFIWEYTKQNRLL